MTVTILALSFLLFILFVTFFGYRMIAGRVRSVETKKTEQCLLCKRDFNKDELIERIVGDHKIVHFCKPCVQSLHDQISAAPS